MTEGLIHCITSEFLELANRNLFYFSELSFFDPYLVSVQGRLDPNTNRHSMVRNITPPISQARYKGWERFPKYSVGIDSQIITGSFAEAVDKENILRMGDSLVYIDIFNYNKLNVLDPRVFYDEERFLGYVQEAFNMVKLKLITYINGADMAHLKINVVASSTTSSTTRNWLTACVYFSGTFFDS